MSVRHPPYGLPSSPIFFLIPHSFHILANRHSIPIIFFPAEYFVCDRSPSTWPWAGGTCSKFSLPHVTKTWERASQYFSLVNTRWLFYQFRETECIASESQAGTHSEIVLLDFGVTTTSRPTLWIAHEFVRMKKSVLKTYHIAAIANSHFKERHPRCVVRT